MPEDTDSKERESTAPNSLEKAKPTHLFKPGQSGNPGGRMKAIVQANKWLEDECIPKARAVILTALASDNEKERNAMARWAWEQRYGKAAISVTGKDGEAIHLGVVVLPGESK